MVVFYTGKIGNIAVRASGELCIEDSDPSLSLCLIPNEENINIDVTKLLGLKIDVFQVMSESANLILLIDAQIIGLNSVSTQIAVLDKVSVIFKRAIKQQSLSMNYYSARFTFHGIEQLSSYPPIKTIEYNHNRMELFVTPKQAPSKIYKLDDITEISIRNDNRYQCSISPCTLTFEQKLYIYLSFKINLPLSETLIKIQRTQQFFEFIFNDMIFPNNISLNEKYDDIAEVLYSHEFQLTMVPKSNKPKSFHSLANIHENIMIGLQGWFGIYEKYHKGLMIWLKQVHNSQVDIEDLIIWNAQCIESICQLDEQIYRSAKELANRDTPPGKKEKEPNIKNYLSVLQNEYKCTHNIDEKFFNDAKSVRDKVIHNNPNTFVDTTKIDNVNALFKYVSRRLICYEIGLDGLPSTLALKIS